MADEIYVTGTQPITVTTSGITRQALSESLLVADYDQLDLLLLISAIGGTGTPTATISLIGGMQKQSEDGWVILASFPVVSQGSSPPAKVNVPGLLKYARWQINITQGTTPSVTFSMAGMARGN